MSIIDQVSSRVGDKTENSNIKVALQCIDSPQLLSVMVSALSDKDEKLVGDCTEVFTKVAEEKPNLIVPYASNITDLLRHKSSRVRWEAAHALALIAEHIENLIGSEIQFISELIKKDKSVIVRDYSIDIIAKYAKCGEEQARIAFPILKESLYLWEGKHAAHAINGFINITEVMHDYDDELMQIGIDFSASKKGVVAKSAKALVKAMQKR